MNLNTLAIDTSGEYLSLALAVADKKFHSLDKVGNKQSVHIINKIKQLLELANILPSELDLIAYVEGPGSFTGLRVGLSVTLGLALGSQAKLIPIPNFAIYALAIRDKFEGDLVVGLDARLNQLYMAGINTQSLDYFIQPQVIDPDKIELKANCALIGNGFSVYKDKLSTSILSHELYTIEYPSALCMLDIVAIGKYPAILPEAANLLYLRNKVAQNLIEQAEKNANPTS